MDDVGAVKGWAEYCGLRHFAAITTTDAVVIDSRDRVVLERIIGMFDRQRGTAGQPDAGVIARAHVLIDPEALADDALPFADRLLKQGFGPALLVEHAFRCRHDHLRPACSRGQRLA